MAAKNVRRRRRPPKGEKRVEPAPSGGATPRSPGFAVKELSRKTWPDFERLFAKYHGVQAGCWCMFYHRSGPLQLAPEEWRKRNRRDKRKLVLQGRSHGIIVYAGDMPVGWCQYGPREELPRIDAGRHYRKLDLRENGTRLWRVTCFFVDKGFRRGGVANVALKAALRSIRRRGGGVVEAYPATARGAVAIWFGSVGMFEREGFRRVAVLGRSNIVMRRRIRAGTVRAANG